MIVIEGDYKFDYAKKIREYYEGNFKHKNLVNLFNEIGII